MLSIPLPLSSLLPPLPFPAILARTILVFTVLILLYSSKLLNSFQWIAFSSRLLLVQHWITSWWGRQAQTTIINGTFMQKAVIANFQVIITDTSSYGFYFGFSFWISRKSMAWASILVHSFHWILSNVLALWATLPKYHPLQAISKIWWYVRHVPPGGGKGSIFVNTITVLNTFTSSLD